MNLPALPSNGIYTYPTLPLDSLWSGQWYRTFEGGLALVHEVGGVWAGHSVGVLHPLERGRGGRLEGLRVQDTLSDRSLPAT
jgi:hypothetical protein